MAEKEKLNRQTMCDRLAMEFQDGWIVNLGVGMPTLCSNYKDESRELIYHSENGVIGYGPIAEEGHEDKHLVNAGGQNVVGIPGMAIVHHADSFMLIRGGMIDVTVMGAYEVAQNGDFANWRIPTRKGGGIGGAMDLAACAKRVYIAMEHTTRDGKPRLLKQCALPVTAPGVVKLVSTDLGLFEIGTDGFILKEHAPGWSVEEIQELTEAKIIVDPNLCEVRTRDNTDSNQGTGRHFVV
ncbi:MAG: succinyl-CoA--3-ketoacid-CoA transferase [Dehalococcoidia bacterium]|nr:succinyl-CoA--3-ketoacid-CoA transferase [Dehalococcoidia bacterium]MQG08454.1 3-oxoacid CoA-transferase subunit B [SAR202 cluster bacterium]MQG17822.1 3-oxoacid CoA-transferase subunit B [SAR202 cluster bacterium]MQG36498.1 3-oxoacid CoA-transferase subunit B [SAR202 cluster bacterium]|tara:strand:- start:2482 stop:3198 length:717 start_codon:yes stop_codon:yes gene_type:complete